RDFLLSEENQHSEPGYRLPPYSPDLECDWLWAYSFKHDGPVLVPQQFCFYSGGLTPRDERYVIETSNGCALGGAYEEAIFHGLLELIERDAYMTRWHVKGSPQRIELNDPAMPQVARLHARATAEGFELYAFAIGIEIAVPTVLAMIIDPRDGASVASYCASGANPHAESAIMGALVEVCSSIGVYQRQFGKERERATELLNDGSEAQDMRDHVLLYSHPEAVERLDFLDRDMPAVRASDIFSEQEDRWKSDDLTAELHALVTEVRKVASDVLVVDQTSSILEPHNLHCVKVLAPGMHPITFGHQLRRLSEDRLQSARESLKQSEGRVSLTRNPHPHNFP
ncbi:MAG: YcaO-like family protein, partial [Pseudomonadota bacterium]